MKRVVMVAAVVAAGLLVWLGLPPKEGRLPQRLVYVSLGFQTANDVAEFERVARRASEHGFTGVIIAIGNGDNDGLEQQLELGASTEVRNAKSYTPLMIAARMNQVECLNTLLAYRAVARIGVP